jgi:hypothetical protein
MVKRVCQEHPDRADDGRMKSVPDTFVLTVQFTDRLKIACEHPGGLISLGGEGERIGLRDALCDGSRNDVGKLTG